MTAPVSVRSLGDQVWAALDAITNINTFRGKVDNPPLDPDGTVHAYAVLYESPGRRTGSRLGSTRDRLDAGFQVTCVGGDTVRCLWCIDKVVTALTGTLLTIPGRANPRRIVEDESNASRYVIPDEDVSPARFFVPLLFNIRA